MNRTRRRLIGVWLARSSMLIVLLSLLLACQPERPEPAGLDRLCEPVDLSVSSTRFVKRVPVVWMENPQSGALLRVRVLAPEDPIGWTTVLVPPGVAEAEVLHEDARRLVEVGAVVVVFDPDGRGKSEGEEDYGGAIHQAGLARVIGLAADLPCTERLGVMSFSLGVVMATGVFVDHPDLPVSFLTDWEGPSDRYNTGCEGNNPDLPDCANEAFWSEREASVSVQSLPVPYHRLQTLNDHVHPDADHARKMLTAALAGGVPGVFLNNEEIDAPPQSLTPWLEDWRDPRNHPGVLLDWADSIAP